MYLKYSRTRSWVIKFTELLFTATNMHRGGSDEVNPCGEERDKPLWPLSQDKSEWDQTRGRSQSLILWWRLWRFKKLEQQVLNSLFHFLFILWCTDGTTRRNTRYICPHVHVSTCSVDRMWKGLTCSSPARSPARSETRSPQPAPRGSPPGCRTGRWTLLKRAQ